MRVGRVKSGPRPEWLVQGRVTKRDLAQLAALGLSTQVRATDEVRADAVAGALAHVAGQPAARLVTGALLALAWLAEHEELEELGDAELTDDAQRRIGCLAEHLAESDELDFRARKRLKELALSLASEKLNDGEPLTFLAATTPTYLDQLRHRVDGISRKWGVYVDLDDQLADLR